MRELGRPRLQCCEALRARLTQSETSHSGVIVFICVLTGYRDVALLGRARAAAPATEGWTPWIKLLPARSQDAADGTWRTGEREQSWEYFWNNASGFRCNLRSPSPLLPESWPCYPHAKFRPLGDRCFLTPPTSLTYSLEEKNDYSHSIHPASFNRG